VLFLFSGALDSPNLQHGRTKQLLDARRVHGGKPRVEKNQILALNCKRQAEEIALVKTAAVRRSATTFPDIAFDCVQRVVDGDLFAGREIALCHSESLAMSGVDITVRIARVIDVAFRRLHQDDGAVGKEIAVPLQFSGLRQKRMRRVDNPGVIEAQEDRASTKGLHHEDSEALD